MSKRLIRYLTGITLVALISAGCSVRGERVESGFADPEDAIAMLEPTEVADDSSATFGGDTHNALAPEAFSFTAPELFRGTPVRGTTLNESGPVLMTFVSPGCPISAEEAAEYAIAAEKWEEVNFVIVHSGAARADYLEWVENADLFAQNILHLEDTDGVLSDRFLIEYTPTTLLVDAEGNVTRTIGALGHEGLANATFEIRT